MSQETRLSELLLQWQEQRNKGTAPALTELCADCPELADELKRRIDALCSMEAMLSDTATLPPQQASPTHGDVAESVTSNARANVSPPGYEVLSELGRGGMGVVYKARQLKLNRTVALKMILAGGHAGPEELQRFRTEAEAVARLQHPGIVQIHEVGEHQGLPYFSLEFVEGGSLDRKLQGAPLPPNAAARLLALLAQAMQAAHEKGILHRDLKPANIFLTPVKEGGVPIEQRAAGLAPAVSHYLPKIGDFGLAKKLEGKQPPLTPPSEGGDAEFSPLFKGGTPSSPPLFKGGQGGLRPAA